VYASFSYFPGLLAVLYCMFQGIRDLADAIMNLADACSLASGRTEGTLLRVASIETRLSELESTLSIGLAEAKAERISAQAERKIARNAENRTHTLEAKRIAKAEDPFSDDEDSPEGIEAQYRDLVRDRDEGPDGREALQVFRDLEVPRRLARSEQALARIQRMEGS